MSHPNDTLIGSEDALVARYAVSRPTLRQAAAMLVQEQLLVVKRGVGGGYFTRLPNSRAVTHMSAIYLRTHDATLEEVIRALRPIRIELARLASANRDAEALEGMRDFLERERVRDGETKEDLQYKNFIKGEREFGEIIGTLSRNKVLSLFLVILYDYAG